MKHLIKEDWIFRREFPGYDLRDSDKISVILGVRFLFFGVVTPSNYTLYAIDRSETEPDTPTKTFT